MVNNLNSSIEKNNSYIKIGWIRVVVFIPVYIIILLISSFTGLTTIAIISNKSFKDLFSNETLIASLEFMYIAKSFEFIGSLISVFLFVIMIDKVPFTSIGLKFKGYKQDLYHGFILGAFMISIATLILYLCGMILIVDISPSLSSLGGFMFLFLISAFQEEVVIRGYILNNLMNSMNYYLALALSSIIFMSFHLINPNLNIIAMINLFLAGILLGIYYTRKRNLWLPFGLHVGWNYFQGPIFGFNVSGLNTNSFIVQDVNGPTYLTGGLFGLEGSLITTVLIIIFIFYLDQKYKKKL